jgi:hypothetical protein
VAVTLHVVNTGLAELPGSAVRLVDTESRMRLDGWLEALAPGQGRLLRFQWLPDRPGRYQLQVEIEGIDDTASLVLQVGSYQVGLADLYLSEVMAAPASGGCEWIEVANGTQQGVNLADAFLRDEDGDWRAMPPIELAPGRWFVLVQDREKFLSWWESLLAAGANPPCESTAPAVFSAELPGGWPSLNNSPPAERSFADRVYLGDGSGSVWDHATLGAQGHEVPQGRSWERVAPTPRGAPARNWGPATISLGATPACRNSLTPKDEGSGTLYLSPNPFYPRNADQAGVLHIQFVLQLGESGWDMCIFDLWGRQVRDLGGDRLGPGPRDVVWDGRDNEGGFVEMGAYVVLLRTYDGGGQIMTGSKRLAVVGAAEDS